MEDVHHVNTKENKWINMLCCITDQTICQRYLTHKVFRMQSFRGQTGQQLGKVGPFCVMHVVHSSDNDSERKR